MGMVHTIHGLIDRDALVTKDIITEGPNDRSIATEWRLKSDPDGECVKREVWVSMLSGQAVFGDQAEI
jgi:hypothetical protein